MTAKTVPSLASVVESLKNRNDAHAQFLGEKRASARPPEPLPPPTAPELNLSRIIAIEEWITHNSNVLALLHLGGIQLSELRKLFELARKAHLG